ncbi:ATP-binding cassette domain-containing protein [Gulosibacter molinativorax]|uniref:ABC transporter domain-containing protein n=1 Tax=Gulosibacter molinativorax TaxID=256821 RepID=A0ABT7C3H7_9MICO|nr:ATP-binding cassette domain-containing protein [Gulosibacter molinativorax]MDJ1369816.1 hypothetical protein [Gulosibacter molinativorax]QUY61781.1 Hypotetical protein [Gulosibacter molinativorax]
MSAPLLSPRSLGGSGTDFQIQSLRRGGFAPLIDVSLTAVAGELTVLLSSDGSGESLLRAAVGVDPTDAGESALQGVAISRRPQQPNTLTPLQVGLLTAQPYCFAGQTIDSAIGQWLDQAPELDRAGRTRRVEESLGFNDLGQAYVENLPQALQHRVAIGRALAPAPAMIAVENPFAELPQRERSMLEGLLRVIAADYGLPVLYASSELSSASRAHHVVKVVGGRVVADVRGWSEIQRQFAAG